MTKIRSNVSTILTSSDRWAAISGSDITTPALGLNVTEYDDFVRGDATSNGAFNQAASGTGAVVTALTSSAVLQGHPGVQILRSGTTTSGFAVLYQGVNTFTFANGMKHVAAAIIQVPVIADGTDDYDVVFGYSDNSPAAGLLPTDGAVFLYDRSNSVSGTNWVCGTANNGSITGVDSGIVVTAATWYTFRIEIDTTPTATFYINGTLVATISTNIPSTGARASGYTIAIIKNAGTTSRDYYVDLAGHKIIGPAAGR